MLYIYILENPVGRLYIGQTDDPVERVARHNRGGEKFTTNKGPWKLIFTKEFLTREEAIKYEKYLKSLKSSKYIRERIIK